MHVTRTIVGAFLATVIALGVQAEAQAGSIKLKDGTIHRGDVIRDNTIYTVFDGLSRVIIRDNRIEKAELQGALPSLERIKIDQPLEVPAGRMPTFATNIKAGPWDEQGRRMFSYYGHALKGSGLATISMSQAINEIHPDHVRVRGITGYWQSQLAISQVPRKTILGLLSTIDQHDVNQRLSVAKFLIQAEWYEEAIAALQSAARDFPDQKEKLDKVEKSVKQWLFRARLDEIKLLAKYRQPRAAFAGLKALNTAEAEAPDAAEARKLKFEWEARAQKDQALAESLRSLVDQLPEDQKTAWKPALMETLEGMNEAPDAYRDRLAAFEKGNADAAATPAVKLALAFSGWVLGPDAPVVADLAATERIRQARKLIRSYLALDASAEEREAIVAELKKLDLGGQSGDAVAFMNTVTSITRSMRPPLAAATVPGKPVTHRVLDDTGSVPTEYVVIPPPEYHPARSYPAIVSLHGGSGPKAAAELWGDNAAKRGYILIAPEYNLPNEKGRYGYSQSEQAAVILALRDASKRYSIDSDRVFLEGRFAGGDMAIDLGLAHPDLFAGVAFISGGPQKYVYVTSKHAKWLPIYAVAGDLMPNTEELLFPFVRGMMRSYPDVTYVEYYRRGPEAFPEEAGRMLDWMDVRRRDPFLKSFEAVAARDCDDRFFGLIIDSLQQGRSTAPEATETNGKNLRPATIEYKQSSQSNLINLRLNGVSKLHVWVGPPLIDFNKRMEVRVNGKPLFKGAAEPNLHDFLEDLRIRGDRRQTYWLKVHRGMTGKTERAAGDTKKRGPRS